MNRERITARAWQKNSAHPIEDFINTPDVYIKSGMVVVDLFHHFDELLAISITEATSGLLGMASLNHLNIPMFGKTSIEMFDICVIASVLTVTAVFVTHDQLMERITNA